eukprot:CAMPEP_0172587184 /NCGR_PEP_ID=MMETSP1068-20121228/6280_1 /TAXON_ID=35684 /ORGANISM="Pseudopedinella elastica, Strain CCMP716" /LENGTH=74 /DNA_ID=CAMNT_0013382117 /DNA_START=149 /DNA_END=373 /DNA_ORIENTATION=-
MATSAVCCLGIGGVYYYSVTKMKKAGDGISEEIELHEANLKIAREVPTEASANPGKVDASPEPKKRRWWLLYLA